MSEFKVGDLITAYHKGYWRVTGLVRRFHLKGDVMTDVNENHPDAVEYNSLIEYEKIADANLKLVKNPSKQRKECDVGYCVKVTRADLEEAKQKELERIAVGYDGLIAFANE